MQHVYAFIYYSIIQAICYLIAKSFQYNLRNRSGYRLYHKFDGKFSENH